MNLLTQFKTAFKLVENEFKNVEDFVHQYIHKFMVKDAKYAINGYTHCGPKFGDAICIKDKSNIKFGSYSILVRDFYDYPPEIEDGETNLAGSYVDWLTTEIEVYQINK